MAQRIRMCGALIGVLGLLGACQATAGTPTGTGAATAGAPRSTTSAPQTSTASAAAVTVGPDYEPFGHFLYKRPFNTSEDPRVDGPIELYVIGHGPVTLKAAELFPDKAVVGESYTSIGTEAKPLIAAAVQVREEAKGLDPQQFVILLAAIDPASQTVLHTTEVLRGDDQTGSAPHKLTGSPDGAAVAFATDTTTKAPATSYAFDAMTGAKLWQKQGWIQGPVLGAVTVFTKGSGTQEDHKTPCEVALDVEVATGKTLHTTNSASMGTPCPSIEVIAIDANGGTSQQAEKQKYVRITASTSDKESTYEARTGADRTLPATVVAADPRSDLVFPLGRISDRNTQRVEPFGVLDTTTGRPAWILDAQKAYQLEAVVQAVYRGRIYLKTTDQAPVVDLATGKTLEDNAARYPIGAVDSWTYWSDGTLDKT
ncbi:hypothetical protein [Labedaea rhizosphaerae]|uniref:Pyrroloquinoline-quinone binding quinoprotein n=1 Tax=Labedaea rhizosphaerae TaxID=598644 RepID=A0A4R6SDR7_LABRH|nr:hypothetical protein [Labedaea rhizosphaerae]TDP97783.1 hypothetical protein EV186_103749 [Labedaea rhizosphaerae]